MQKSFRRRMSRGIAVVAGLFITAALAALVAGAVQGLVADESETDAVASVEQATNDEEWLQVIARAKAARQNPDAPWPEPALGEAVQLVRSCSDLPDGAVETQMAIEVGPDGRRIRFIFTHFDASSAGRFALVLYSGDDVSGCSTHVQEVVQGAGQYTGEVDRHLCEQMEKMAKGEDATDRTLRPASPEVAREYLDVFCE